MATRKMTPAEIIASAVYFCFILAGIVLSAISGTQDHSVFRPLPYALGDTYDAKTIQLAENYQDLRNHHRLYQMAYMDYQMIETDSATD